VAGGATCCVARGEGGGGTGFVRICSGFFGWRPSSRGNDQPGVSIDECYSIRAYRLTAAFLGGVSMRFASVDDGARKELERGGLSARLFLCRRAKPLSTFCSLCSLKAVVFCSGHPVYHSVLDWCLAVVGVLIFLFSIEATHVPAP